MAAVLYAFAVVFIFSANACIPQTGSYVKSQHACGQNGVCRPCRKEGGLILHVDCKKKSLHEVPKLPNTTTWLDLSNNNICSIELCNELNDLRNLEFLSLSNNGIEFIDPDAFRNLKKLRHLSLMGNCLYKDDSFITSHSLQNQVSLERLEFTFESSVNRCPTSPTFLFDLFNLKDLEISAKCFFPLNKSFKSLTLLTNFTLTGVMPQSSQVNRSTFSGLPHLGTLRFEGLSKLSLTAFMFLPLKRLGNFSILNPKESPDLFREVCSALQSIQTLRKLELSGFHDNTHEIYEDQMKLYGNEYLIEVYFDDNRISYFGRASHILPQTLSKLSLDKNCLEFDLLINHIVAETEGLEELSARKQTKANSSQKYVHIHPYHTSIRKRIPQRGASNLKKLAYTRENKHDSDGIDFKEGYVPLFKSITHLDLSRNRFKPQFYSRFGYLFPKVEYLTLTDCDLGTQYWRDQLLETELTTQSPFKNLTQLKSITLDNTPFYNQLPKDLLQDCISLSNLSLRATNLSNFELDISNLLQLQVIDLSDNNISQLSSNMTAQLDAVAKKSKHLTIDLSGNNNIVCSCDSHQFLVWMSRTQVNFTNAHNYMCTLSNGRRRRLYPLDVVIELTKKECDKLRNTSIIYLIVIGVMSLVLVISATVGFVRYKYRWQLIYWYYTLKLGRERYVPGRDESFEYDAFVSCTAEDEAAFTEEIKDMLETRGNLHLIFPLRNFTPGRSLILNILESIQKSRKTMVLFSKAYLKNNWCKYQLNMARMESITNADRDKLLLVVMLEDISREVVPLDFLEVLKNEPQLEFPRDRPQEEKDVFWEMCVDKLRN